LFKSWFVDFDPVRAKAEGRDPALPKHLADLFPDAFQDSELGQIPKGWEVKCIEDVVSCVGGSTPSTKNPEYWEGGTIHWTTPKDLSGRSAPVLIDTERKITPKGLRKIPSGLLPAGTLLLSSRAPVGYLAIAQIPVAVNQGYIAIPPRGELSPMWMLFWADRNMDRIKARAGGTTFQEISKRNFRAMRLIAPACCAARAFDKMAAPIFERIVKCVLESRTVAALRDALLPKLISGELRVKDAIRFLERSSL
ncbi:MAG: restriction endonuclease subunit S, partial [Deltaproteobacteria bacterium]